MEIGFFSQTRVTEDATAAAFNSDGGEHLNTPPLSLFDDGGIPKETHADDSDVSVSSSTAPLKLSRELLDANTAGLALRFHIPSSNGEAFSNSAQSRPRHVFCIYREFFSVNGNSYELHISRETYHSIRISTQVYCFRLPWETRVFVCLSVIRCLSHRSWVTFYRKLRARERVQHPCTEGRSGRQRFFLLFLLRFFIIGILPVVSLKQQQYFSPRNSVQRLFASSFSKKTLSEISRKIPSSKPSGRNPRNKVVFL